jgi:hypothetical protein
MTTEIKTAINDLTDRVDELEEELARERAKRRKAETRVEELEDRLDETDARVDAVSTKSDANAERVAELQSRELEKGAHLRDAHVDPTRLTVADGRVERIQKDDGPHVRLPGSDDPLGRGGSTKLAHADLLPIQQLAQMDDDMLHSAAESRPTRLAAELWRARDEKRGPWSKGSGPVRQYVDASELAVWIRSRETGVSKEYGQKLASRVIDCLTDLTKNRMYDELRNRRKDGLQYKERRLVLPTDSSIPGEADADQQAGTPQTAGVGGE